MVTTNGNKLFSDIEKLLLSVLEPSEDEIYLVDATRRRRRFRRLRPDLGRRRKCPKDRKTSRASLPEKIGQEGPRIEIQTDLLILGGNHAVNIFQLKNYVQKKYLIGWFVWSRDKI